MNEHIKGHLSFNPYMYEDLFRRHSKQITVTKVVKSYVIPWRPRARTGSLQLMCQFGKQGRLLPSAMPSPCHPPCSPPTLPQCSCAAGVSRNAEALCLEWHCCLIPHGVMSLLPPTITTQCIRNTAKAITEFIHCLCYRFEIHSKIKCQPSLFTHKRSIIWKLFYIHLSLLMANPNASPQTIFHMASH